MALSKARKITIAGTTYQWKASHGRARYLGDAPSHIRLMVFSPKGALLSAHLTSKNVSYETSEGLMTHKATLGPGDVAKVITAALCGGWDPNVKNRGPFEFKAPDLTDYTGA